MLCTGNVEIGGTETAQSNLRYSKIVTFIGAKSSFYPLGAFTGSRTRMTESVVISKNFVMFFMEHGTDRLHFP